MGQVYDFANATCCDRNLPSLETDVIDVSYAAVYRVKLLPPFWAVVEFLCGLSNIQASIQFMKRQMTTFNIHCQPNLVEAMQDMKFHLLVMIVSHF
jgi:hypothetical protein